MKKKRQIGTFASLLLLAVVSSPVVGTFNRAELWAGMPVALWGMLGVWAAVMAVLVFLAQTDDDR